MGAAILELVKLMVVISLPSILLSLLIFSLREKALRNKKIKEREKDSTN